MDSKERKKKSAQVSFCEKKSESLKSRFFYIGIARRLDCVGGKKAGGSENLSKSHKNAHTNKKVGTRSIRSNGYNIKKDGYKSKTTLSTAFGGYHEAMTRPVNVRSFKHDVFCLY
jgi:hypothetical protein